MNNHKLTYLLLATAILVNFSGLFIPIIGPDGTLYASIAKLMAQQNNYIELFAQGKDWLDKPHFPFWVTALSFEIFGIKTWAYKLPGILFMMMGVYYTYRFAKELYNKEVGLWSAIILLTAQHIVLSNNDVRAEPYLTGLIIASIYHFHKTVVQKHWAHLLAGCVFAACAIMTKGMFALIPICGAIGGELIVKKRWKELFHLRWLAAAVLILLFISPELYCLYYQFDAHPEKTVFGTQGVSGIRFFFWDSQFGRFFNTGPIKGKGDVSFFLHTLLWAFLPWSLLLYAAFIQWFRKNLRNPERQEWYCFFGSLATFLVFSLSKFQLPHYMNIVFPLLAIITTQYLFSLRSRVTVRRIYITQMVLVVLLILLAVALFWFYQPEHLKWHVMGILMIILITIFVIPSTTILQKALYRTVLASVFVNLFLNWVLYPDLLKYQSGSEAGKWMNAHYKGVPVVQLSEAPYNYPLEFYADQPLKTVERLENMRNRPFLLYAPAKYTDSLKATGGDIRVVKQFEQFHISKLTGKFINKATRQQKTEIYDVLLVR